MLALIAERASGQRFSAFAEASIFKALGMSDTHFHEDLTRIVKHPQRYNSLSCRSPS
jgi:CubicO group peptidase (beta-lactamase class C family)